MTTLTKPTLGKLIESTNIPASLVRAVVGQLGGWESFTESAADVCRGGIDGGFHGFIYTAETNYFAKRNRRAIAEMAADQADDIGQNVIDMVCAFGCLGGSARKSRNHDEFMAVPARTAMERSEDNELRETVAMALYAGKQKEGGANVLNALAWYAGEEVCRAYVDMTDRD